MRIEIPKTEKDGQCDKGCLFFMTCKHQQEHELDDGNLEIYPLSTCPGPGVYELVPVEAVTAERKRWDKQDEAAWLVAKESAHRIAALRAEIAVLRRLLTECANEIESYVKAEYGWPDVHPAQQSEFDAGMFLVNDAREAAKGEKP